MLFRSCKPFLLHSSFPLVQVPSLCFCLCFFFLPTQVRGGVSCLLGGLRSSASVQWVFYRSNSTCRCISDVSVGRKVISTSYSSAIFSSLPRCQFLFDSRKSANFSGYQFSLGPGSCASHHSASSCLRASLHFGLIFTSHAR